MKKYILLTALFFCCIISYTQPGPETCNGTPYDTETQGCCDGVIYDIGTQNCTPCGVIPIEQIEQECCDVDFIHYDPETHHCTTPCGVIPIEQECCGRGGAYDPKTQECGDCGVIPIEQECCQHAERTPYDPETEKCTVCGIISIGQECCEVDKIVFDPETQKCTPCGIIAKHLECCQEAEFGGPVIYDPETEKCEAPCGVISKDQECCARGGAYDPKTQECDVCGVKPIGNICCDRGSSYDPDTEGCCEREEDFPFGDVYDLNTQECTECGVIDPKTEQCTPCGIIAIGQQCCEISLAPYDPETEYCTPCGVLPQIVECCEGKVVNPETEQCTACGIIPKDLECCDGAEFGGPVIYDPETEQCTAPCGVILKNQECCARGGAYDPKTQDCDVCGVKPIGNRCCDRGSSYDPETEGCCDPGPSGIVYDLSKEKCTPCGIIPIDQACCEGNIYDPKTQKCTLCGIIPIGQICDIPGVSITSPANNAIYIGPADIPLVAEAIDPDGIRKIQFFNGTTLLATQNFSPYKYTWHNRPAGDYSFTAQLTNNKGVVTTSDIIHVTVVANKPPTVSTTSPGNNANYVAPAAIRLVADANDPDGTIKKVQFYSGTTLIATQNYFPYALTWYPVQAGSYELTAKAIDDKGMVTTSDVVQVTVTATKNSLVNTEKVGKGNNAKIFSSGSLNLKVSPVPAKKILNIYTMGFEKNKKVTISVLSVSGVIIKTINRGSNQIMQMDVSSLRSGVYFLKVLSGEKVQYTRFVKL